MSKRIVFLYCTQKNKENLLQYEGVIRALLRKFRKSALFSYVQIDTSPSCHDRMCNLIQSETSRSGAIFLESDEQNAFPCTNLLENVFGVYAVAHHISGRTLCYPKQAEQTESCDGEIIRTAIYKKEDMEKTAVLSLDTAKAQKRSVSICLEPTSEPDSSFLEEAQKKFGKEKHIAFEYLSLDEMISLCMKTIPSFDVVLTLKDYAPIISMHLNSMPDIPAGYIVYHGEKHKVYKRQTLPHEEVGNLHHLSSLLSIAAIFENEFKMKNVADWFRRALSLAFTREALSSSRDFLKGVIREIETPIRKRRTE